MAIAQTPEAKKSSINSHINTYLYQFMAQNSISKSQKLASFGPANGQSVTYSKIQIKVCGRP